MMLFERHSLFILPALLAVFPFVSNAQPLGNLIELMDYVLVFLNSVLTAVFLLALVVFAWGIVKYLTAAGDAIKVAAARGFLWWGILGIFVMAALWGILRFIGDAVIGSNVTSGGGFFVPPRVQRSILP